MTWLLDTNVVSEWTRPQPDPGVIAWLDGADEDHVFLSVVTLAEVRDGTERLPAGQRRARLEHWLEFDLSARFEDRLLSIDPMIADQTGRILARVRAAGRTPGPMDAFIAATAVVHDLTLVTRNVSDFEALGVRLLNPWQNR